MAVKMISLARQCGRTKTATDSTTSTNAHATHCWSVVFGKSNHKAPNAQTEAMNNTNQVTAAHKNEIPLNTHPLGFSSGM